ncbi:unnamed protein product [Lathyrus sativus]|nr:unnamed protein product [Lathyrus sativus]
MIISWNVKGINNSGKCHEVISHLKNLNPVMAILIETKVKFSNVKKVINKFGNKWQLINNYVNHNNGRIWILWDDTRIKVVNHGFPAHHIHCSLHYPTGELINGCTTIYAHDQL